MYRHSVYVRAAPQIRQRPSPQVQEDALVQLAMAATSDRHASMQDVRKVLQNALQDDIQDSVDKNGTMRILQEAGYLTGDTKLSQRGFDAAGRALLRHIMRGLSHKDAGGHDAPDIGYGQTILEGVRPYEPGDDMAAASIPDTLQEAYRRAGWPCRIRPSDVCMYETQAETRVAVSYCIDLSSTMRTRLRDGSSRMEAARRALWGLYQLNRTRYPQDAIHIIGFASMAARIAPYDIPRLQTFDANDGFLHYTNYQAALRLARRTLRGEPAINRRIVMITDGHPSACDIQDGYQKDMIVSSKPYASFYQADDALRKRIGGQKGMRLDADPGRMVYLCYKYKKVDDDIDRMTVREARHCVQDGIQIDFVVISDEDELIRYAEGLADQLGGGSYVVRDGAMANIMVRDHMRHAKSVIREQLAT